MSKWAKRIWMVGVWAGIGVLVGMQLASSGGPAPDSGKNPAYASTQAAAAGNGQAPAPKSSNRFKVEEKEPEQVEAKEDGPQTPEQILSPETGKPTVDVLADKTAGLLQNLSQKGIRLVVSVFDSITE
ncbi:MAG TPA: hypothetical protein VNM49_09710 [Paenibacillus cookii]|uniref:DUF4015 domain-containing protein n=1 Tax=Paenibacillus cookii TaxID=157839 RepID=A0ABQ4LR56_9BACL|nr:hypothetical protein [Paenibacillus cookii]GIO65623.1 hypothetical protein J21TS3_04440 [Paenibacillus cookii]HWO54657.1 hypothetical protein [Paenibacillus cookii]